MTAIPVDDEIYRRASEAAAAQGKTVDEFVGELLKEALPTSRVRRTTRNGLPVMIVEDATGPIDPARIREFIEEEGF